jgi:amyloid beta precursor protein binding protein 1
MATTDKYDRQLRLWGASGQRALSESTVVLIRATACGTETLKNLVLPGIGHMIIVDDLVVVENNDNDSKQQQYQQYASNFFLTSSSTTASRAEQALEHLQELNPDVQGSFRQVDSVLEYDLEQLWQSSDYNNSLSPSNNSPYSNWIFILADPEPPLLIKLSKFCQRHSIPLIVVTAYGLIGMVQLQITPAFPLINPKPRNSIPDLRLVHPFPQLVEHADTIMREQFDQQKSHIPYPILLLHVQKQWKEQHDGNLPCTFADKQAFQQAIRQLVAAPQSYDQYLNVQEAVQWAYTAYSPRTLPLQTYQQIVQTYNVLEQNDNSVPASCTTPVTAVSSTGTTTTTTRVSMTQLIVLLRALLQFFEEHEQQPPLSSTSIPDMHASTALYIGLQTIYRTRALEDWKEFTRHVRNLETQTQTNPIPEEIIQTFCQNVFSLDVLDTGTIHELYKQQVVPMDRNSSTTTTFDDETNTNNTITTVPVTTTALMEAIQEDSEGERPEQSPLLWYLGYRACQMFYEHCGRFPGTTSETNLDDVDPVHHYLLQILKQYHLAEHPILSNISTKDIAIEMVRYGNAEIHTIASVVGGVASQEAVKIITGQYVPINNTYVYNGIASIGGVYRM